MAKRQPGRNWLAVGRKKRGSASTTTRRDSKTAAIVSPAVTHATMYPHDDLGNNIYLVNLPAITQVRDASSPPFDAFTCDQFVYGSNTNATMAPSLPDVTQAQSYTATGCGGDLVTVKHSYDASGNAITATDGDNHQGCPA